MIAKLLVGLAVFGQQQSEPERFLQAMRQVDSAVPANTRAHAKELPYYFAIVHRDQVYVDAGVNRLSEDEYTALAVREAVHLSQPQPRRDGLYDAASHEVLGDATPGQRSEAVRKTMDRLIELKRSPVALLTLMELEVEHVPSHLAQAELGVYSPEVQIRLAKRLLTERKIPIVRSTVSREFSVTPMEDGTLGILRMPLFRPQELATDSARNLVADLNAFFDREPQVFDVRLQDKAVQVGRFLRIKFAGDDAVARAAESAKRLKSAVAKWRQVTLLDPWFVPKGAL